MNMIYASNDLCLPLQNKYYGRTAANSAFLHALFSYGNFQEFHFFYGDLLEKRLFEETYFPWIRKLGRQNQISLFPIWKMKKKVSETDYTILHRADLEISALIDFRNSHCPYVPVTGLTHSVSYHRTFKEFLLAGLAEFRDYDAVICTSDSGKKVVQKLMKTAAAKLNYRGLDFKFSVKLSVIPLGIDEFNTQQYCSKEDARRQLNICSDCPVVLCFGRFSPHTKYDLVPILDLIKNLEKRFETLIFLICGDNSDSDYKTVLEIHAKKKLKSESIRWIENPDSTMKHLVFSAADLFFSPSDNIQETFGLTVVEAMSYGLPIVASNWNGYRDVLRFCDQKLFETWWNPFLSHLDATIPMNFERDYHYRFAQNTILDLKMAEQQITEVLNSEKLQKEMSERAKRCYIENFEWAKIIHHYESLWTGLKKNSKKKYHIKTKSVFAISYPLIFNHYPSNSFNPEKLICFMTEKGQEVMKKKLALVIDEDIEDALSLQVIQYLLARFSRHKRLSSASLISVLKKKFSLETHDVLYTLIWMAKHGLISHEK